MFDVIDNIDDEVKNKRSVNSKLSILLLCTLVSPICGTFLYCLNLYRVKVAHKIPSLIVSILLFSYFIRIGFIGLFVSHINYLILNLFVGLLLVTRVWENHFIENELIENTNWTQIIIVAFLFIISGYFYSAFFSNYFVRVLLINFLISILYVAFVLLFFYNKILNTYIYKKSIICL